MYNKILIRLIGLAIYKSKYTYPNKIEFLINFFSVYFQVACGMFFLLLLWVSQVTKQSLQFDDVRN